VDFRARRGERERLRCNNKSIGTRNAKAPRRWRAQDGYKIFDRYKEHGLEALSDRSRRPVRYANQLPA
jgi:hypothetical protein